MCSWEMLAFCCNCNRYMKHILVCSLGEWICCRCFEINYKEPGRRDQFGIVEKAKESDPCEVSCE